MTNITTNTQKLSSLLPYDSSKKTGGTELKAGLREFGLLLTASKEATTVVENGGFEQFDALVSENACQIRALKIAGKASTYIQSVSSLKERISKSQQKIEKISAGSLDACGKQKKTLQNFFDEGIDVELTSDELFLIKCYLLFVAKIDQPQKAGTLRGEQQSTPKQLYCFDKLDTGTFKFNKPLVTDSVKDKVSIKFLQNLVNETRITVASDSVLFIRELAESLNDSQLKSLCSSEFEIIEQKRRCIPMFWTYKTLLLTAKNTGIPILLSAKFVVKGKENKIVDEECIIFKPLGGSLSGAAIVVEGFVCTEADKLPSREQWKATLKSQTLSDIILAGAADHRQYPDEKYDCKIEELKDPDFEKYKQLAKTEGFAEKNPSLFFIKHVFAQAADRAPKNAEVWNLD